jgi:ribosomal protein S27E
MRFFANRGNNGVEVMSKFNREGSMNEIKCPQCGTVFTIDEAGYAEILKQVRDAKIL